MTIMIDASCDEWQFAPFQRQRTKAQHDTHTTPSNNRRLLDSDVFNFHSLALRMNQFTRPPRRFRAQAQGCGVRLHPPKPPRVHREPIGHASTFGHQPTSFLTTRTAFNRFNPARNTSVGSEAKGVGRLDHPTESLNIGNVPMHLKGSGHIG